MNRLIDIALTFLWIITIIMFSIYLVSVLTFGGFSTKQDCMDKAEIVGVQFDCG